MKKIAVMLLSTLLLLFAFGCAPGEESAVKIIVPDGAPALTVANVMKDKTVGGRKVEIEIATGDASTSLIPKVKNGEADLAIVPTNAAAKLFNAGIDLKLVTANTYGLLYLMGSKDLAFEGLDDLVGKVVQVIGQGQTPDLVLRYLLDRNEIAYEESETAVTGKVAIHYIASGTTLIEWFAAGKAEVGVLGEPAATAVKAKAEVKQLCDLQEEWKKASGSEAVGYPQASLVVQGKFLKDEKSAEFIGALVEKMTENLTYLSENPEEAKQTLAANGGSPMALNATIVSRMNLRVVPASDAKSAIESYLTVLMGFDKTSVGGKLPADGFYYTAG